MLQLFFFLFYKLPLAALSTFLDIYLRWALVVLYTRISLGSLGLKPELMGGCYEFVRSTTCAGSWYWEPSNKAIAMSTKNKNKSAKRWHKKRLNQLFLGRKRPRRKPFRSAYQVIPKLYNPFIPS